MARARYAAFVMVPPAWLSTTTGVSNQLISGSEPLELFHSRLPFTVVDEFGASRFSYR